MKPLHHPRCGIALALLALFLPACVLCGEPATPDAKSRRPASPYEKTIVPLLSRYCHGCHGNGKHKGDVTLDGWKDESAAMADRRTWERVLQKIQTREMPPENKPQPGPRERAGLIAWIEKQVFQCDCEHPDPGRVTIRRLNRAEYNNTIRDLLGVDFKPANDFPVDDSGYGFDNIGDALSLSPVLVEKYLAAAQTALDAAIGSSRREAAAVKRYPVDLLEVGHNAKQRGDGWIVLNSIEEDDVAVKCTVTTASEYVVRVHAYARQDGTNAIQLTFLRDKTPLQMVAVETNAAASKVYEARLKLPPGPHRLRAAVRRDKAGLSEGDALKFKNGAQQKGAVIIEWLEVEGPLRADAQQLSQTHRRIFFRLPAPGSEAGTAREILERFARRAFRRPVTPRELDWLVQLEESARSRCADTQVSSDGKDCFEEGIRVALQAVLVSPHFLFRGELQPEPDNPKSIHPVNEFALASRLSYFLWSTMPDDELLALAAQGKLRRNRDAQVRRMLQDPKSRALVDNFAGQWLQIRLLDFIVPDPKTYTAFDEPLRLAMKHETELLFETVMREDRSVLEFIEADWTFMNERLARHYGVPFPSLPVAGSAGSGGVGERGGGRRFLSHVPAVRFSAGDDGWRRVSLIGTPRRGVLTHAGILTLTSNPTRTSPVKRGKWVLENLFNAPPPPPPPNVPELNDARELKGTLRQRMEQHRADPLCASCHERMDAIGFGLENFDGIGAWRAKDGKAAIDAGGQLGAGQAFSGPQDLVAILATQKQEQFTRCLVEKLLTYALGRGLELPDRCAVDEICRRLPKRGYKFSALVGEIVKSTPFQLRRGDVSAASVMPPRAEP